MIDKTKYIKKFKELYKQKNNEVISDDLAFEYFEKLVCLVGTITSDKKAKNIILPKDYETRKF